MQSKPALWAMMTLASATKASRAALSILCPATISSVMPVNSLTGAWIEPEGWLNAWKIAQTPVMTSSSE
jgi:hypothetical protein